MRRTNLFLLLAIAAVFGVFCSCQKEQLAGGSFSATMEQYGDKDSKVVYDSVSRKFSWQLGDTIQVLRHLSGSQTLKYGEYKATTLDETRAIFTYASTNSQRKDVTTDEFSGPYYAFYPQNIKSSFTIGYYTTTDSSYVSGLGVNLKTTQLTDEGGNLIRFPMFAESEPEDQHLHFKNLCGLVRLSLQKDNTSIYAISVTTEQCINGSFTVDNHKTAPQLTKTGSVTDARKTVRLTFGAAQSINTRRDFYIALPAGTYDDLQIKIYATDGKVCTLTKQSSRPLQIARNKYTRVDLTNTTLNFTMGVVGYTGGLFSVSSSKVVLFSQGNLQYKAHPQTWRFAENQYDRCFSSYMDSTAIHSYYLADGSSEDWVDMFGWGTSGYDGKYPHVLNTDNAWYVNGDNYDITGTRANYDWGVKNPISNGGNTAGLWRTLTKDEWKYLLETRPNAGQKWARATVCDVPGVILLPDVWTYPTNSTLICGSTSRFNGNNSNTVDATWWGQLETAGAVFLPASGYFGYATTTSYPDWQSSNIGTECSYWSSSKHYQSTHPESASCLKLGTSGSYQNISNYPRRNCLPVRLVHDVE